MKKLLDIVAFIIFIGFILSTIIILLIEAFNLTIAMTGMLVFLWAANRAVDIIRDWNKKRVNEKKKLEYVKNG